MDLQNFIEASIKMQREAELKYSPQLLLGDLITKLEKVKDKTKPLFIDIAYIKKYNELKLLEVR